MRKQVTTYYLQMQDPQALCLPKTQRAEFEVRRCTTPQPELNQFLFRAVGGKWRWYSRLGWDYQQWQDYLTRQSVETWLAYVDGTPAGYFELLKHKDESVEIYFIGLLPAFIGRGYGGLLLSAAVQAAWQMGAARVWLHTCSEDHPSALENYQRRGFTLFETSTKWEELPDDDAAIWLTAGFTYQHLQQQWRQCSD